MSTDDNINTDANSESSDHSHQDETQNSESDHSDSSKDSFDARNAFNKTNERLNLLAERLEKLNPRTEEVNGGKTQKTDKTEPDLDALIEEKLWLKQNESRISANESVKAEYEKLISSGIPKPYALELAESRNGVRYDSSEHDRQKKVSSTRGTVDRSDSAEIKVDPALVEMVGVEKARQLVKKYGKLS